MSGSEIKKKKERKEEKKQASSTTINVFLVKRGKISYHDRLVPSRYLSVFWDERRLGIRLRRAQGLMGREEGKIATHETPRAST